MPGTVIPQLGGGLGNRLFQFAAAAGLAEKWERQVWISPSRIGENSHGDPTTILSLFPSVPVREPEGELREMQFHSDLVFEYVPFPESPPGPLPVAINGYFQAEQYFPSSGVKPNWQAALGDTAVAIETRAHLVDQDSRRRTWMIHFRMGDYRSLPMHQVDLRLYYRKCLMSVPNGARLHVFSDEPELCREFIAEEVGDRLEVTWATSVRDVEALYEMSLCWGGAITANSTFSWWGAYFARQGCGGPFIAYYPDNWGAGLPPATDVIPLWGERVFTAA